MSLIEFTNKGLYCAAGDFHIDPWRGVDKAIITHAHSDHARGGSKYYLCHHQTKPLLQLRLGDNHYQAIEWNEPIHINGVKISLHPAGHIIGSSQVRLEYQGEIWVVSGDYKTENDGISGVFEPIRCHTFISESTFGLPIYNWRPQQELFSNIQHWINSNHAAGKTSVLVAYSLGKAQRLLPCIAATGLPLFLHGSIDNVHQVLKQAGWKLPFGEKVTTETPDDRLRGSVVLAPGSVENTPWMKRFGPYGIGVCSGWMQVRGRLRSSRADAGFAMSDHADWNGLLSSIKATGASKVFITHGFQSALSRFLNEEGIESAEVETEYDSDEETENSSLGNEES